MIFDRAPRTSHSPRAARRLAPPASAGLLVLALVATARTAWARPPAPWPGPAGDYVFVEAESFHAGVGWAAASVPTTIFTDVPSGLRALSGKGAGDGHATKTVTVPAAGTYQLWINYLRWPLAAASRGSRFRVQVTQGGSVVFDQTYDGQLDPTTRLRPKAAVYGQLDWVAHSAPLAAGPAEITVSKVDDPATTGSPLIDCLLLTTDTAYDHPDYRDFAAQTYLRIHVASADPGGVDFPVLFDHMHVTWYAPTVFGATGARSRRPVASGAATPWINISRDLNIDSDTHLQIHAEHLGREVTESDYDLDLATAPDDRAIAKTLHRAGPGGGLQARLPPNLTGDLSVVADYEWAQQTADMVRRLPPVRFGRRPTLFHVVTELPVDALLDTPGVLDNELLALAYLGLDGLARPHDAASLASGLLYGRLGATQWGAPPYDAPNQTIMDTQAARVVAAVAADPAPSELLGVKLADEARPPDLAAMVGNDVDETAFVTWLRAQGKGPGDLGVTSWDQVHLTDDKATTTPALYLYSQEFRAWSIAHFYALVTRTVHHYMDLASRKDRRMPRTFRTMQNFSDGATAFGNLYSQGNDYATWFGEHALDIAQSEDWSGAASTKELSGWNVALLRSATKYHHEPIYMHVITGRGALRTKLKAYADLSQGAKTLEMYAYVPPYAGHENNWYRRWDDWPAIAELTREIGAAEDLLVDVMPRPAETAILYSTPYDIWNVQVDNLQAYERMHTYLALRHAQIPVDVVSDRDVRDGALASYKVVYLFGEQLDHREVTPLVDWVRQGGTLVLSPGAGSKDELNRASTRLDTDLALERESEELTARPIWGYFAYVDKHLTARPDRVHLLGPGGRVADTVDAFGPIQRLGKPTRAQVLARFADAAGSPAAVMVRAGRGRVVMVGFMPALAYIKGALDRYDGGDEKRIVHPSAPIAAALAAAGTLTTMTWADYGGFPYRFDGALRDFIVQPARTAGVATPVSLDVAQVEATFMEDDRGWAIPLANWTGAPLASTTVTIDAGRPFTAVYSSRRGLLAAGSDDRGRLRVSLPLESTDVLYAYWPRPRPPGPHPPTGCCAGDSAGADGSVTLTVVVLLGLAGRRRRRPRRRRLT